MKLIIIKNSYIKNNVEVTYNSDPIIEDVAYNGSILRNENDEEQLKSFVAFNNTEVFDQQPPKFNVPFNINSLESGFNNEFSFPREAFGAPKTDM